MSGIGKVSERMLAALGISTCTHLHEKRGILYHLYSNISSNYFLRISLGIGSTQVERYRVYSILTNILLEKGMNIVYITEYSVVGKGNGKV